MATATVKNMEKFDFIRVQRNIKWDEVVQRIRKYAEEQVRQRDPGLSKIMHDEQVRTCASNIRKELSRREMTEKVLRKGLHILGLTDEEIQKVLADA